MVGDYYVDIDGQTKGPYTILQLRSLWSAGVLTRETLYCEDGFGEWVPLGTIQSQLERPSVSMEPIRSSPARVLQKSSGVGKALGMGCLGMIGFILLLAIIGAITGGGGSGDNDGSSFRGPSLETRRVRSEGTKVYTGPGLDYPIDSSGGLFPEETLYVLDEHNGWIHFRVTPKDVGWSGWVSKDETLLK